ncbi:MAG: T9SS type A sorting domain-containing protein [Bacteroidia bacterium]|nr:T9SS type A sorting domain-containing protein [Bacteroidia bacterium]
MISTFRFHVFLACSIFFIFTGNSNAQEPIWATTVSGPSYEYGIDVDMDSDGNIFMIGYGTGPVMSVNNVNYNSNGDGDAFIGKLSPSRQLLWFTQLGGSDNTYSDGAEDIHVDSDDNVIVLVRSAGNNFDYNGMILSGINSPGQYSGEGVIIKIDNNGNYMWHDHGTVSSSFQNVTTDTFGNVYLTGWFSGSITLGDSTTLTNTTNGTTRDMFIAKYSPDGNLLWAKHAGGTVHNAFAYGHNIAIDPVTNKVVVMGRFSKAITFETGILSTTVSYATFVVVYDEYGTELWRKMIFTSPYGYSYCQGLDISPNGVIGVAGFNSLGSSPDGLVGFYDLNGNILSEQIYTSPYCRLSNLEFNQSNECFITGRFQGSVNLGSAPDTVITLTAPYSGFILKLNDSRVPLWTKMLPASFENKVTCKDNKVLYAGRIDQKFIYNYNADTIFPSSGDAVFAEIADLSGCQPIDILQSAPTANSVVLSWETSGNATSYSVRGGQLGSSQVANFTTSNTSVSVGSLPTNTSFWWQVAANCGDESSDYSDTDTFTTTAPDCNTPSNVQSVVSGPNTAQLNWDAVPNAVNYVVRGSAGVYDKTQLQFLTTTSNTLQLQGLPPNTYFWQVQAVCNGTTTPVSAFSPVDQFLIPSVTSKRTNTNSFTIYPNPFDQQAKLRIEQEPGEKYSIVIYNTIGQIVEERNLSGKNHTLSKGMHPAGVYYLELKTEDRIVGYERFVVR